MEKTVPEQRSGSSTGATTRRVKKNREDAIRLFHIACERLLDINHWEQLCGKGSARFDLVNEKGERIPYDRPQVGYLIRIQLPAPANSEGDGYDWVQIEKMVDAKDLKNDQELFGFHVRPARNPNDENPAPAHFYTAEATSSFLVFRNRNLVIAMERGRNEKPNTNTPGWWNRLRNLLVALAAMTGLSKPQWKRLTEGLLNTRTL